MKANFSSDRLAPREGFAPVGQAQLYFRVVGQGWPIIALHGGPDFNHTYLLPELDRLAAAYRLIYYDQRGRGKSRGDWQAISLQSEIDDLDGLRQYFALDTAAVLGHSWGGVLGMEYALRHPERVSHLILMNTAPASYEDYRLLRQEMAQRTAAVADQLDALRTSAAFQAGDPATVAAFYRLRFRTTTQWPEHLERLDFGYARLTQEDVLRAWAIEERLYQETFLAEAFNLLPRLQRLATPTLIIHGDDDFVPLPAAARIAQAIPGSRLMVLEGCGHFAYLECPEAVRQEIVGFLPAR